MMEGAEEAMAAYHASIERLLAIALAADCRLAVSSPVPVRGVICRVRLLGEPEFEEAPLELVWEHVMLMPGEKPPAGKSWTIYERRGDGWQGRSA